MIDNILSAVEDLESRSKTRCSMPCPKCKNVHVTVYGVESLPVSFFIRRAGQVWEFYHMDRHDGAGKRLNFNEFCRQHRGDLLECFYSNPIIDMNHIIAGEYKMSVKKMRKPEDK